MDIDGYRRRIDDLDWEIVRLLNERAQCAIEIGKAKEHEARPVFAPGRERQVLEQVAAATAAGPLKGSDVQAIYREVMASCRALEKRVSVAYWGPPASNTHVAARRRFGTATEYVETGSIQETFQAVERGRADVGVAPVENSTEGVIARTLDMFLAGDLRICAEIYVPIQHNLLSNAPSLDKVRRVYTMFQATAQCRDWLSRNLPGVELVETTTTARGAALAAEDPEAGAIANSAAAEEYGVKILAEHIEDNPRNRTRFWVVGRLQPPPSGKDKTSILFSVPHRSGALVRALDAFSRNGVSLTFIESRPTKETPWEYVFFVDALGHPDEGPDAPLGRALAALREECAFVRVLGSYPESEDA